MMNVLKYFHLDNVRRRPTSFFSAPEASLYIDYQHSRFIQRIGNRVASLLEIDPLLRMNVIRL